MKEPPLQYGSCIHLAACANGQELPSNPLLPADLFTSCLTTPIKTALRWYTLQNKTRLLPEITLDMIDKYESEFCCNLFFLGVWFPIHICRIPGQMNDRRTMLGELNWIFTAVTDTIAWNSLPRGRSIWQYLLLSTDWLIDLLIDWLTYWSNDWLIAWLIDWLIDW